MKTLPENPDLSQLKQQAKELLAAYRRGEAEAHQRFRLNLPAARGLDDAALSAADFRLHDAQSCLAREYGLSGWAELKASVEILRLAAHDRAGLRQSFARYAYGGDLSGGNHGPCRALAKRLIERHPGITEGCLTTACGAGDLAAVRAALARDPGALNRPAGPLALPPIIATTHSGLLGDPAYRPRLLAVLRFLLDEGTDATAQIASRWPPASLQEPDPDSPLSALYGAAGVNHDPEATALLLKAGADPNDGESLYHAVESPDCIRLLLAAGAVVTGTNALFRSLDMEAPETLRLLLAEAADAPELQGPGLLAWAIRRRRSPAIFRLLLAAGCDPEAMTQDGLPLATLARRYGLPEVAALLGGKSAMAPADRFLAACARGDEAEAGALLAQEPGLIDGRAEADLRMLPELAAAGVTEAVRLMVALGWPIETRGGDWRASALNHAVFRGDAELTAFLLAMGASWRSGHGMGDNVLGTLGWASQNRPEPAGDWVGCARALLAHGLPAVTRHPEMPQQVLIEGQGRVFSEEVTAILLGDQAE